jgi:broad specificity phosphatase PhoE
MKILLVRHAEMAGDPFVCPARPVSGCLSERGLEQAGRLAEMLADTRIDVTFSSPYGRALQTAEIVLGHPDALIQLLPCLREWEPNRDLESLPSTHYEDICRQTETRYAEETWKTELGEGCFEMYARIVPPLLEALAGTGVHPRMGGFVIDEPMRDKTIAIFAHGGSLGVVLAHLLKIPPFPVGGIAFKETGVATLEFTERQGIHYPVLQVPPCVLS